MHSRDLAHCDLKPLNIVLNRSFNPKLIDFGHAQVAKGEPKQKGSWHYMAPELIFPKRRSEILDHDEEYNYKYADCWSLGVTLFQMFYKVLPFDLNSKLFKVLELS